MIISINIPVKKNAKNILLFYCSDTTCPTKDSYNKLTQAFTINETEHIEYEKHSYIIPKIKIKICKKRN